MVFPLLFPSGDLGWSIRYKKHPRFNRHIDDIKENNDSLQSKNHSLSILQFYSYRLAFKPNQEQFNPLLYAGKLTQQFFIHALVMVENNRMNFFRNNQKQSRIESMAIVRSIGRPDLFITMTCNPKWKKIKLVLEDFPVGTTPNDIPNIVVRLFHTKFHELLDDVIKYEIFGRVLAYIFVIEFQRRGLPYAHLVVTLHPRSKSMKPQAIDKYISAEISNNEDHKLRELVIRHMLHGPHTEKSPCFNSNKDVCLKKFPENFRDDTIFSKNGYTEYKRTTIEKIYTLILKKKWIRKKFLLMLE